MDYSNMQNSLLNFFSPDLYIFFRKYCRQYELNTTLEEHNIEVIIHGDLPLILKIGHKLRYKNIRKNCSKAIYYGSPEVGRYVFQYIYKLGKSSLLHRCYEAIGQTGYLDVIGTLQSDYKTIMHGFHIESLNSLSKKESLRNGRKI